MRTILLLLAPLLVLQACAAPFSQAPAPVPVPAPGPPGQCNAANAQFAVGRTYDIQLQAEARQRSGAMAVRVYRTGDSITMDYSTQRLNLELDASGKVVKASCG